MQLTRSGEYGLKGLVFLAKQPPRRFSLVSEVSRQQKIPEKFLAKIFQRLSKAGLLRSARGSNGGFALGRPAKEITIRNVTKDVVTYKIGPVVTVDKAPERTIAVGAVDRIPASATMVISYMKHNTEVN